MLTNPASLRPQSQHTSFSPHSPFPLRLSGFWREMHTFRRFSVAICTRAPLRAFVRLSLSGLFKDGHLWHHRQQPGTSTKKPSWRGKRFKCPICPVLSNLSMSKGSPGPKPRKVLWSLWSPSCLVIKALWSGLWSGYGRYGQVGGLLGKTKRP